MVIPETELEMVMRHVGEGRAIIDRQHAVLARMEAAGRCVLQASALLAAFVQTQDLHDQHLAQLERYSGL